MPRLIVEAGKQIGSEFDVTDRMRIGRLDSCQAALDDDNASREHAAIRFVNGRYYVLDLNSRNGTTVNGTPVKQSPLSPGDRIGVGDTVLLFFDEEHAKRPTDTLNDAELKAATGEERAVEESGEYDTGAPEAADAPAAEDEEDEAPSAAAPAPKPAPKPAAAAGPAVATAARPAPAAPPKPTPAARAPVPRPEPPPPPPANEAAEAALFALLLVLTFLCMSYATQIILRLVAA